MSSLPKMRLVGLYKKQKVYEGPRGGQFIQKKNYRRYLCPHYQEKVKTAPFHCPLTEFAVAQKRRGGCIPGLDTVAEWWFIRERKEISHMNVIRELLYPRISDKNMRIAFCKQIFTLSMPHTDLEFIKKVKSQCVATYRAPPDDYIVPTATTQRYWMVSEGLYKVRARVHYHQADHPQRPATRFVLKFTYHPDCGYGAMAIPHALGTIIWWADQEHMLEAFEQNKKNLLRWVAIMEVARTCPGCFRKKVKDRSHNHLSNTGLYCDNCDEWPNTLECNICKKTGHGQMKIYSRYGRCHIACHVLQTCSKRDREAMRKQFRP